MFVEREENVKADIFHAYVTLLKQTKPQAAANDPNAMDESEGYLSSNSFLNSLNSFKTYLKCFFRCSPLALLQNQVASLVKAIHRQLRDKSIKNRQGCFLLLTELVQVLPGALNNHIAAIVPGIQFSLGYAPNPLSLQ